MSTADRTVRGLSPADHCAGVATETTRIVTLVKGAELTTPIPSCPGWTLADLIRHVGGAQRWFSALLRERPQVPPPGRDVDLRLPVREEDWANWLADSAAEAAGAFAATDPDTPMWAWGADQHARFWERRMLFETLLHRVDAELSLGIRPRIYRALAVDGVDEFLVNLPFATAFTPKLANLRGARETIRLQPTDVDTDWLIRLRPDGFGLDPFRDDTAAANATVRAGAADLLLLVYGRLPLAAEVFERSGDEELLTLWFANSEF
ncbi:maleylpyruvate isomerase family mycothiol-dependent enzyme (plasmid) [Kitasatospora sp. NBC_00070]|uniref:maleylpyruvate isomerase family mycothiol-dependent enzyme n=1 Tax=Kitasatospora sp. NBC_00070 TaxID=2975962 RepID=UPI002F90FC38